MRFPPTDEQSAILGAVFLAIDLASVVYALVARPTQPDPQRGQAIGCLMIVSAALVILAVLLAFAWRFHIGVVVRAIAGIAGAPLAYAAVCGICNLFSRWVRPR